jgi:hypothetical protein
MFSASTDAARAWAAAMNIASETRFAFEARTPSPTPGKMYALLLWAIL